VDNDWGNFVFDTNDDERFESGRRLVLHLPSAPNPVIADVFLGTIGPAADAQLDGDLRALTTGSPPLYRRMNISWVDGNLRYSLRWNGMNGTLNASFSCVAPTTGACTRWIASGGDASLYSIPTKGRTTETYIGTYPMPFEMTLDRQP